MASVEGRSCGGEEESGVGGFCAGPAVRAEVWPAGASGCPREACWARSLRSDGSRWAQAWPGQGRSLILKREHEVHSHAPTS